MERKRIALLRRERSNDGATLFFTSEQLAKKSLRARAGFVARDHVPEFEGDYGWFEMEHIPAKPRSYWRAVRQVEPPAGWTPPPAGKPTPRQLLGHSS